MAKNILGELMFCIKNVNGVQVFKPRNFMIDKYPKRLIEFYESKIQLIGINNY